MKPIVIAGTSSGTGKTTVTLGLMGALAARGLVVRPFKAGPDYIDPGHHSALLGVPSYNLDTWMMGTEGVKRTFKGASAGADVAVVEGVMGLFDGKGGTSEEGSTAHIAKIIKAPVLLVVDAAGAARSVAAVVKGFREFDPGVNIKWVVFNRVGSRRHFDILREAVKGLRGVRVAGYIPRDKGLHMPSRHLGLVTRGDLAGGEWSRFVRRAVKTVDEHVDLDVILGRAARSKGAGKGAGRAATSGRAGGGATGRRVRIGVALDRAFCFYYQENLDVLRGLGAEPVFFSPMKDTRLPAGIDGLYLGGGYPEVHARGLAENHPMREAVRRASASGMPVFAECGGLMYLSKSLVDIEGRAHQMAGVFPFSVKMTPKRRALGYREVKVLKGCPFLPEGGTMRGHEYHYSEITGRKASTRVFADTESPGAAGDGFIHKNTLAGYTHLHFSSNPEFARGFVGRSADWGAARG